MNKTQIDELPTRPMSQNFFTTDSRVACDGGKTSGHPKIWLTLVGEGQATCPYCSCHFVKVTSESEVI